MLGTLLAAILATAWPLAGASPRAEAEVVAETLDVLDEPDAASFLTARLHASDRVAIVEELPGGWMAIEPPLGSICWIDQEAINELGDGEARVIASRAVVRTGRSGARMPGPPRWTVGRGAILHLLDRPPLVLNQGRGPRTWQAIEPLEHEVRFIRADGIRRRASRRDASVGRTRGSSRDAGRATLASERVDPIDQSLALVGPTAAESALPAELATALPAIEAMHRAQLRLPVDQWNLEPVKQRYQALLDHETDASARAALRARIDRVVRQQSLTQAARAFESLLAQSRQHDRDIVRSRDQPEPGLAPGPDPYDGEGLLQPSSRQVDGQILFALIGTKGQTSAYLSLPPGIDAATMLGQRVGVRGRIRFNESLSTNLIYVRELETLSDPP